MKRSLAIHLSFRRKTMRLLWAVQLACLWSGVPLQAQAVLPTIEMPMVHLFNGKPVRWHEQEPASADGIVIAFSRLEYLLSNMSIQMLDGTTVSLERQYFHLNPESGKQSLALSGIPAGKWKSLQFMIGLPEEVNHANPAKWPAGHPLNVLENNLHWGWKGGYVFLAAEGYVDTKTTSNSSFLFHLGSDQNAVSVTLAAPPSETEPVRLELVFHVDKLLRGQNAIDVGGRESLTHSAEGDTLAPRLAQNLRQCFELRYEH